MMWVFSLAEEVGEEVAIAVAKSSGRGEVQV